MSAIISIFCAAPPDRSDLQPYDPEPLPGALVPTRWLMARLSNGAEVYVGRQERHSHTGGIALVHEFRHRNAETGRPTVIRFSSGPEAAAALSAIYQAHGISFRTRDFSDDSGPWRCGTCAHAAVPSAREPCCSCAESSNYVEAP